MKNFLPTEKSSGYRVRNALNPLLWVLGLFASPVMITTIIKGGEINWLLVVILILIVALVGVVIFSYLYLLFRDPDRLQSEDFQIRNRAFDMIESKGEGKTIDAESVVLITNPDVPRIGTDVGDRP